MTNLSPEVSPWRRRFSRERLIVGLPLLVGVVGLSSLLLWDAWPRLGRLQEQKERLEDLRFKQASLPGLRRELSKQQIRAQKVAQEQALLVDLIAGRDQIQTFLAEVGRVADATGVVVNLYQPSVRSAPASQPSKNSPASRKSRSSQKEAPKDPLRQLGYVKTSVLLEAEAPYESLLAFLRRMESLQLLVEPSDLSLKASSRKPVSSSLPGVLNKPSSALKLRLSFFDRVAEPQSKDQDPQRRPI